MRKTLKNRMLAGLMAFAMVVTTWVPAEQVGAEQVQAAESSLRAATNTTFASARELQFNTSIAEEPTASDTKRYYKFTVDEASELNIGVKFEKWDDFTINIYDAAKTNIYTFYKSHSWWTDEVSTGSIYLTGGTYYVEIITVSGYSFVASTDSMGESFVETQDVNNDMVSDASSIALKKKYKGVLAQNDEVDYYTFTVPAAGKINFNMTNATNGRLKYTIYDSSMNASYVDTVAKSQKESVYVTLAKGTYYLAITKDNTEYGVGSYNFSIDYVVNTPDTPKIKSAKNSGKKKMTVKWNKVTDIDGYEIQYSTSKTFKSSVTKKTVSASKTSASYSKLKKGKTYYVRMRSYVKVNGVKKYSKWSTKKTVKINK